MLASKNKKSLDSRDQKDLSVTIILCSFPDILYEERIHSWKNYYDALVFGKWFGVTVILTSHQTTVYLFGVFLMIKFQTYEKSVFLKFNLKWVGPPSSKHMRILNECLIMLVNVYVHSTCLLVSMIE